MLQNYVLISFRYLRRHKTFTWINLIGLALGLCLSFFAFLFVDFEYSYDAFNTDVDRTYRVVTDVNTQNGTIFEGSWGPLAAAIQTSCPEVQKATHFFLDYVILRRDNKNFREEKIAYTDASLFSVFTLPLIRGTADKVLNAPWDIVLSESAAHRYFGEQDPVGQTLWVNGKEEAHVTGVMRDMPLNSHFRVDVLVSKATLGDDWMHNWKRFFFNTYVVLPEGYDPAILAGKLPAVISSNVDQSEVKYELSLEPLRNVYLDGKPRGSRSGSISTGDRGTINAVTLIAVFILFIACFNFVNLSTAFSLHRAREIGVRKVMGGSRYHVMIQFLIDAILISLIAFVGALVLFLVFFPLLNSLAGKPIITGALHHAKYIVGLLGVSVLIGVVSGIYPAFFLSGFEPIKALKGRLAANERGVSIRKTLVTIQFIISALLITGTIVVYTQISYLQNHDTGFRKDRQVVIDFQYDDRVNRHEASIKAQFMDIPHVELISMSSSLPGKANHIYPVTIENAQGMAQPFMSDTYFVDYDFLKQFEIEITAGRPFSREIASDSAEAMIINEAAARGLGYANPEDAIGKPFKQLRWKGVIIGVISDFQFHSLREKARPLTMVISKGFLTFLTLSLLRQEDAATVSQIEKKWRAAVPGLPFIYFFEEENYRAQYGNEERFGRLFFYFAMIAIFISCLGLVGLTQFSIAQRTKEIGVRKVHGSSVVQIVMLLGKELLTLLMVAIMIAAPLAWVLLNQWLSGFANRIAISVWMVLASGVLVMVIAFIATGWQTAKAALANPIDALRSE
jgi:putative ABC transport system permease protein